MSSIPTDKETMAHQIKHPQSIGQETVPDAYTMAKQVLEETPGRVPECIKQEIEAGYFNDHGPSVAFKLWRQQLANLIIFDGSPDKKWAQEAIFKGVEQISETEKSLSEQSNKTKEMGKSLANVEEQRLEQLVEINKLIKRTEESLQHSDLEEAKKLQEILEGLNTEKGNLESLAEQLSKAQTTHNELEIEHQTYLKEVYISPPGVKEKASFGDTQAVVDAFNQKKDLFIDFISEGLGKFQSKISNLTQDIFKFTRALVSSKAAVNDLEKRLDTVAPDHSYQRGTLKL